MSIVRRESPDGREVTIKISGSLDFHDRYEFTEAYACDDPSEKHFILDMENVDNLDSSALGMLLIMRNDAGEDKSQIKIINCGREIKHTLLISKFDKIFKIE